MAEWATLRGNESLRKNRLSLEQTILPFVLGFLLARGGMSGVHPFGGALGAALLLRGGGTVLFGLGGLLLGAVSLHDASLVAQLILSLTAQALVLPRLRGRKREGLYLFLASLLSTAVALFLAQGLARPAAFAWLMAVVQSVLSGGLAFVFWYAMAHQEAVLSGDFAREQGIAWLLLLVGSLSGLEGLHLGSINPVIVLISFFVLFASERYGAGTAAGVGALLGFLPQLNLAADNLLSAGIFALAGFCTGAFQRFRRWGIGMAFAAATLLLTVFLREEAIFPQLISSALGLLLFFVWPSGQRRQEFLKSKPMPEVESTVTKVKALAEIFDQIALSYQAAEAEAYDARPEVPELMNVLVERVCQTCPTLATCWEREFYKTYRYLFDLFALVEGQPGLKAQELPVEWKRHCGRLKEMLLGIQFIMEQEKSQEAWRRRLAKNQEALSQQFQSVSQVIGNLAKELHAQHNLPSARTSSLARRRRHFLDVGAASFCKTGNTVCGDNYASLAFSPTHHAFIVSDGMGAGENAAKMSAAALKLLEQLLSTGFEPEGAVQALNSILVLRSPEESFVTVDMAILDLESDQVKLVKVGAAPSYLVTGEEVQILSASGLPAGILNQIEIPVLQVDLAAGDSLVLATDGLHDIRQGGWLEDFLKRAAAGSSQELADAIVAEARQLSNHTMQDDGVVIVVRKNFWTS